MWVKKDIWAIYSSMSKEQMIPLLVTNLVVTLVKVVVLAGCILLIKWLIGKIRKK